MSSESGSGPTPAHEPEPAFGPPQGTYDAAWVAAEARAADPGLSEETARELAVYAWDHLSEMKELDAPELARRLFLDHKQAGASAANFVAKAAVDFCREYDVQL